MGEAFARIDGTPTSVGGKCFAPTNGDGCGEIMINNQSTIAIRAATADDAATASAIIRAAFAEQAQLDPPSGAIHETEARVRERLATGSIVLAEIGGVSAGCVYYELRGDMLYFGRLAVLPAYRQRGIGAALIAHAEQRAHDLGATRIQIGVRLALPRMRARYERLGYQFVEARSHEGYHQPTWVILEKLLTR